MGNKGETARELSARLRNRKMGVPKDHVSSDGYLMIDSSRIDSGVRLELTPNGQFVLRPDHRAALAQWLKSVSELRVIDRMISPRT